MPVREFRVRFNCAPGDVVASTALIRDLKTQYGDDIRLHYETNQPAIIANNPYLNAVSNRAYTVELDYSEGLKRSQRGEHMHFISWFHKHWEASTGMPVRLTYPWPDLHLEAKLRAKPPISGKYWLMFAGGKTDCTIKHWDFHWYEQVAKTLKEKGVMVVQSGAIGQQHVHPPCNSVAMSLVGWGGLRELLWQIYHCQGVICPITCAMHVAAAFHKPCVVIAGGREEPWWEAYDWGYDQFPCDYTDKLVKHWYLNSVGKLACCEHAGCGRVHVRSKDVTKNCTNLAMREPGRQELPYCMDMIRPQTVVDAVLSYGPASRPSTEKPHLLAVEVPFHTDRAPLGTKWMHPRLGKVVVVLDREMDRQFIEDTVPKARRGAILVPGSDCQPMTQWVIFIRSAQSLQTKWFDELGSFIMGQEPSLQAVDTEDYFAIRSERWTPELESRLVAGDDIPSNIKCWSGTIHA